MFKDTSDTLDASEVVFALFYPHREKLAKCEGFIIKNTLESKFRLLQVIKNRYGLSDRSIGLNFFGEISLFREMPKPEEINDYGPYLSLKPITTQKDTETCVETQEVQINKFIL